MRTLEQNAVTPISEVSGVFLQERKKQERALEMELKIKLNDMISPQCVIPLFLYHSLITEKQLQTSPSTLLCNTTGQQRTCLISQHASFSSPI